VNRRWYVVQVFTGQEQKIKAYLDAEVDRLEIRDQIANVLIPSEEIVEMKDGRKKSKKRIFFPGYLLLEAELTKEIKHLILNTPSVIAFGGTGIDAGQSDVDGRLGRCRVGRVKIQLCGECAKFPVHRHAHLLITKRDGALVGLDVLVFNGMGAEG